MNEYLQQIFAAAGGQDIDPDVAAAGALLSKVAEEQGVDLDNFSDEEIGGMLQDIMGGEGDDGGEYADDTDDHHGYEEPKTASAITVADVSAELAKTAAAEGIDLTELDRQQYHQAFNWQLEQMQDPSYFETKVAMQEKVAEADMLGRVMAHSFNDELEKIAGAAEAAKAVGQAARKAGWRAGGAAKRVAGAAGKGLERLGKGTVRTIARTGGAEGAMDPRVAKAIGAGVAGAGAAGLGGAAYGAKKLHDKKKKESGLSEYELMQALTEYGWSFE